MFNRRESWNHEIEDTRNPKRHDAAGRREDQREWRCSGCTTSNFQDRALCRKCNQARPEDGGVAAGAGGAGAGAGGASGLNTSNSALRVSQGLTGSGGGGVGGGGAGGPGGGAPASGEEGQRDQWRCPADMSLNFLERPFCRRCGVKKPDQPQIVTTLARAGGGGGAPAAAPTTVGEWVCKCGCPNFVTRAACRHCAGQRPASVVLTPASPGGGGRSAMRSASGGWGRGGEEHGQHQHTPAPAADPAVAGAAQEIERVEAELEKAEQEISTLRAVRRQQEAGRQTGDVPPKVLVETVYRENMQRNNFVGVFVAPKVEPTEGAAANGTAPDPVFVDPELEWPPSVTQPSNYEVFQDNLSRFQAHGSAVKAEIRRRKLGIYHRMRMVGEHTGKLCEPEETANGSVPTKLLRPGGVVRLAEMAMSGSFASGEQSRWDTSLAREVDMVWNRDPLRYVFDDQTQRVRDPELENLERRQMLRWTDEEQKAFVDAYRDYGKEFHVLATKKPFRVSEVAPKSTHEMIAFYYHIKHRIGLKQLVSKRGGSSRLARGDRGAMSSSAPPIPRELLNLGITSEAEVVAYLVAQNKAVAAGAGGAAAAAGSSASAAASASASPAMSLPSSLSDVQFKTEQPVTLSAAEKRPRDDEASVKVEQAVKVDVDVGTLFGDEDDAESSSVANVADFVMPEVVLEPGFDATAHATVWSPLEASIFLESLREFGPNFEMLAKDTGKTAAQCAAFFVQNEALMQKTLRRAHSKRGMDLGEWNDEEKVAYRQCVMENGRDWKKLAETFPGKSADQCRALWSMFKWRLGLQEAFRIWTSEHSERPTKVFKSDAEASSGQHVDASGEGGAADEQSAMSPPMSTRPFLAETQDGAAFASASAVLALPEPQPVLLLPEPPADPAAPVAGAGSREGKEGSSELKSEQP